MHTTQRDWEKSRNIIRSQRVHDLADHADGIGDDPAHGPGTDRYAIAAALNAHGLRSGRGHPFTTKAVANLRYAHGIRKLADGDGAPVSPGPRPDGRYSTRALAREFGVTIQAIRYWRTRGFLPAIQETSGGPWWHEFTPERRAALCAQLCQTHGWPQTAASDGPGPGGAS